MENQGRIQPRRRMMIVCGVIMVLLAALTVRVYTIQVIDGPIYAAMAQSQQQIAVSGVDGRGEICDRSGEPLTGAQLEYVYVLRRDKMDDEGERLIRQLNGRERSTSNDKYRIVTAETYEKEAAERLRTEYGAYVLQMPQRYEADQAAVYLLGYVRSSDGVGVSGLERAFDGWLSQRDKVIYGVADAANRILPGYGIQNSGERVCRLITTLDKSLQQSVEQIVYGVERGRCCAIVTEVETGDILACATAPGYDPMQVEELLESDGEELLDIALQGTYPPGSVFKIAVAAAVLESGICAPEQQFTCTGSEQIGDVIVGCTSEEGHGSLTMEQAFAKSCNCAFIQMGQKVGAEGILEMAEALGLGSEVLNGLNMDKDGNLPTGDEAAGAGIANLSIGQGTLLVTPLQVAQMTQIVAGGGVDVGLYLANALEDENGTVKLPRQTDEESSGNAEQRRVMSSETAEQILQMMQATVEYGTAQVLSDLDCGGKTGSAEGYADGEAAVHAWFTGVAPADDPQYAVTVFVEGGGSGGSVAAPVFEEILLILESSFQF